MLQLTQSLRDGSVTLLEVPCPQVRPGHILIRTHRSLVSPGTERMLVEFGKANWVAKARQQPDKVREVLSKVNTDGFFTTINAVQSKLDQPLPLGYSNMGTVLEVSASVEGFVVGDRVLSNGAHAEVVCVPNNLCARVPNGVSDEDATFTVLGAIALQGIRLSGPTLGETFMVLGLGVVGLLTVQLLRAHGCRVIGADFDPTRLDLARQFGAETVDLDHGQDPVAAAMDFSRGRGVDGVLVTAATDSSEPIHQAALMSRQRGRIILVGVTGLELSRADFYEKELTFQVSCSYGPGRYDAAYEENGHDYPYAFVRWTEQRNFEAVLDMMADRRLVTAPLVSHRFPFSQASVAYETLMGTNSNLGLVLEYPASEEGPTRDLRQRTIRYAEPAPPQVVSEQRATPTVAVIGAGNYATRVLIPAVRRTAVRCKVVASAGGLTSGFAAARFGFEEASTDVDALLADPEVDAVVIATRHDSHARLVSQALEAGKHVFVEKPLAITEDQLEEVKRAYASVAQGGRAPVLMVGFNRRFAPHIQRITGLLEGLHKPKAMVMTVNAGAIPADHWTQQVEGGGRIIGEACHFLDLLRFLAGSPIAGVQVNALAPDPGAGTRPDTVTVVLSFEDGSVGTVHYFATGHKSFPKERLEVFCGGRTLVLDNFRKLRAYGWPRAGMSLLRQDKGHRRCMAAFVGAVESAQASPIPFDEIVEVTRVSIETANVAQCPPVHKVPG